MLVLFRNNCSLFLMIAGKDRVSGTKSQVDPISKKMLRNTRNEELRKGIDGDKGVAEAGDNEDYSWRWKLRHMQAKDCMIICSGGDCLTPSVDVVPKLRDTSMVDSELRLLRMELDVMQDKMREDKSYHVVHVCPDFPGAQESKDYYLERMKQLMTECKQPGGRYHM